MKRVFGLLCVLLSLLMLSACSEEPLGTWSAPEEIQFSLDYAMGIADPYEVFPDEPLDIARENNPGFTFSPKGWLDDNTILCTQIDKNLFSVYRLVAIDLDGTVHELIDTVDDSTCVQIKNGYIIYGKTEEMIMPNGVSIVQWSGSDKITEIHQFDEGDSLSLQLFFNPAGTKAVMSWAPEVPGTEWKIRIIDLETKVYQDVIPPDLDKVKPTVLCSRWLDDNTILVTAVQELQNGSDAVSWEYALS